MAIEPGSKIITYSPDVDFKERRSPGPNRKTEVHTIEEFFGSSEEIVNLQTQIDLLTPANQLLSGGVIYTGSGLTYESSSLLYRIADVTYMANPDTVTLAPSDPTNPRIDVIYIDDTGFLGSIAGTPDANPVKPTVDNTTQLELTFVTVDAGATTLGVTIVDVFDENLGTPSEWAGTTNGSVSFSSVVDPNSGTLSIETTSVLGNGEWIKLTPDSPYAVVGGVLSFKIKAKSDMSDNGGKLRLGFFNSGSSVGDTVQIGGSTSSTFGFIGTNTSDYQTVVIDMVNFGALPSTVDELRIYRQGGGSVVDFFMDDVSVQEIPTTVPVPQSSSLATDDQVLTETVRNIDLDGDTSTEKLVVRDSSGNTLLNINGNGQVWSYGKTGSGGTLLGNTGFGEGVFNAVTTGNGSTGYGTQALSVMADGNDNCAFGRFSGGGITSGDGNAAFGYFALARNVLGDHNTAVGMLAGDAHSGGILTSVNDGVFIGHNSKALSNNSINEIVIGATATGNGNNTVTLGNNSVINTYLKGDVNIVKGGFEGIFTHANTVDRTYTLPDTSGTVALTSDIDNFANTDLTFAGNRQHNLNSNTLEILSDGTYDGGWLYMDTTAMAIGNGNGGEPNQSRIRLISTGIQMQAGNGDKLYITDTRTEILSNLALTIGSFDGVLTHANTVDRTYTLPDATGTVALTSDVSNFADTDLTFSGNRAHDTDGNSYELTTDAGLFGESWEYLTTTGSGIGFGLNSLDATSGEVGLTFNGTQSFKANSSGLVVADAIDIVLGTTAGTKIGTATTQKIGFYNSTPVVQPTALTAADATATDSTLATAETIINNLRTRLNELETKMQSLGLLA